MKVPNSIKIGAYDIKVLVVDMTERGEYETEKLEIRIKQDMDPQQVFSVFLHECVEAINDVHDLKLEEPQIMTLEQEITRIFLQLETFIKK